VPVVYRIAKRKFATSKKAMMSGRGALLYGGRWNSPGRPVVYASQSLSLATLEIATQLTRADKIMAYRHISLDIPEDIIMPLDPGQLPRNWDEIDLEPKEAQDWGNAWFDHGFTAVLEVPSVIIPSESNYLINPEHPDFALITQGKLEKHPLDPRIKQ